LALLSLLILTKFVTLNQLNTKYEDKKGKEKGRGREKRE
jgi:hypothetical protein